MNEDAQIHPEMAFSNFQMEGRGRGVGIKDVDIDIEVVPADTWVVGSAKSDDLLKHEQGHYDIVAICAQEMYKAFRGLVGTSTRDLQTKLDRVKHRLAQKVTEVDARYDVRTNHSRNTAVQQTWDARIASTKANPNGSLDDLPG